MSEDPALAKRSSSRGAFGWYWRRSHRQSVSVVARLRLRYFRQARTNARQTCSTVTAGFFPPKLRGVQTDEGQGYQTQRHRTLQRPITAAREGGQTPFAFRDAEHLLDIPTHERGHQHAADADAAGGVGDEILDLARLPIPRQQQSVAWPTARSQGHVHRLDLPHRRRAGLLLDAERFRRPFLHAGLSKHRRGTPGGPTVSRPARERLRHFPHVVQARHVQHPQEVGLAALPLIERQPVQVPAVLLGARATPARSPISADRGPCPECRRRDSVPDRLPTTPGGTIRCRAEP
jgi:hypothetical protein